MPSAAYPSKTSWQLQLDVAEGTLDAPNNRSFVSWGLYIYRGNTDQPFNNAGTAFSVSAPGGTSGTFGAFRFGSTGTGTNYSSTPVGGRVLIASGGDWVTHDPDGTGSTTVSASHAAASTLGTASIGATTIALTALHQLPNAPTSVAGARVSDTSINVSWAQSSPTNGQPTSNTVRRKINGGAFADAATISPATSVALAAAANQKIVYGVKGTNALGDSAWSADSVPVYTTPAAPTGVAAAKVGSDIQITWTPNVAFSEHQHVVEHGVVVAGVTTWDGSPLALVTAGTSSYTHVAPNPAQQHVYRVSAKNTDTGALQSATVLSNVVVLLIAPAKPSVAAPAPFQDKAATFRFAWVHNSIDTTTQTKRQVRYSLDGGSTWTTGAKTADTNQYLDFAGSTWTANTAVTFEVRTKGTYDSGSDGDPSYSPWSDPITVTFKTKPVATITAPANSSTYTQAALTAVLGFSQAEAATFVKATIDLYQGATLLEEVISTTLAGTLFATALANGGSYTLKATVTDSNGLVSAQVTSAFTVSYTQPVAAVVAVAYLPDSGLAQLTLTIPGAGGGLVAATAVTIDRVINGVTENIVTAYPSAGSLTFLDTTPTINGTNLYKVTTISAIGATNVVQATLVTDENEWAFMSKGPGYQQIVRFELAPGLQAAPSVDSAVVKAAGRSRPIALYATTGDLVITGSGALAEGYGSTPEEIEAFLLVVGKGCYRDPSGRRVFGLIAGSISLDGSDLGQLSYTVTETS